MKGIKSLGTLLLMGAPAWLVLAGVFHSSHTSVLIHVDEPGVTVWVDELPMTAESREVGPVVVRAGEYRVRVVRDGVPVFSRMVTVSVGETAEVWAHWSAREEVAASRPVPSIEASPLKFEGHYGTVTGVGATADGGRIISAGSDGTLRTWDATTGVESSSHSAHVGAVSGLAVLADGRRVMTAGDDGLIRLWDLEAGEALVTIPGGTDAALQCAAASADGRYVAIGSTTGLVKVFEAADGRLVSKRTVSPSSPSAVAFTPDGRSLLVSTIGCGATDHRVELWETATGALVRAFNGHVGPVWCVATLPDGRRALTGGSDRSLRLWDLTSGKELARYADHPGAVFAVALAPDGRRALAGTSHLWDGHGWADADGYGAQLWDIESGEPLGRFDAPGPVRSVAFSPDGQQAIAGGEDRVVRAWRMPVGTL